MTTSVNVFILGHGEMGQAMEYLLKDHHSLAIWEKFPRTNHRYISLVEGASHADIALFCLPVNPHREVTQQLAPLLKKTCVCVSIAKGLDEAGKNAAQIFAGEFTGKSALCIIVWSDDFRRDPRRAVCIWSIGLPRYCHIPHYAKLFLPHPAVLAAHF